MSIIGIQIEFAVPTVESFKRVYDYQIRTINIDYSIDGGDNWYPFKEILTPSGSDSIPFSTVETPMMLLTYTLNGGTVVHPNVYSDSVFSLKFSFEMFSNNAAFDAEGGERVYVIERRSSSTYVFGTSDPFNSLDPDGFPTRIVIDVSDNDVV
jgi:hypothetical protein